MMVEPRSNQNFKTIINSVENTIDSNWDFYIFTVKDSIDTIKSNIPKNSKRKYIFEIIPKEFMIKPTYVNYSKFLMNEYIWNKINAEHILLVQTDVGLCDHNSIKPSEFTQYPYIGCAYSYEQGSDNWWKDTYNDAFFYGVGGMSMRKKSFMLQCIQNMTKEDKKLPEDVFFSNCLGTAKPNVSKPSNKDMHKFCVESDFSKKFFNGKPKTMGVHKPSLIYNNQHRKEIVEECPIAHNLIYPKKEHFGKLDKTSEILCFVGYIIVWLLFTLFSYYKYSPKVSFLISLIFSFVLATILISRFS